MVKDISLYIPCYNAEKTIAECLEAVKNQTYPVSEIIIIDDGSTDNTVSIASKYDVQIIQHKTNLGLAASRNTGVLNSKNEYIASLDADCVPHTDWLERLIGNFTQDNIAGVGGKLLEVKQDTVADRWRARHLVQNWGDKTITNPRQLFGNNTIFRKSCLTEIGLYNPIYKTNLEDYDISLRLIKKGYNLIYEPLAKVEHIRSDNIYSVMDTYTRYYRGILVNIFFSISFLIKDLLKLRFPLISLDAFSLIYSLYKNICRIIQS